MKVGFLLPIFRWTPEEALAAAALAERYGIDGVFTYDHLWPMGSPERPALAPFPMLSAVATRFPRLNVGPLVARVGLVSPQHLIDTFRSLSAIAPGRVIAALGTGDRLSAAENQAYGMPMQSVLERQAMLGTVASALTEELDVWIGAGAATTNEIAERLGVTLNFWQRMPEYSKGPWNWAGNARDDLESQLDELRDAGSSWAVFSPTVNIEQLGAWRARNAE